VRILRFGVDVYSAKDAKDARKRSLKLFDQYLKH